MTREAVTHEGVRASDCLMAFVSLHGNVANCRPNQLKMRGLERETGFEPATFGLEGRRSTN